KRSGRRAIDTGKSGGRAAAGKAEVVSGHQSPYSGLFSLNPSRTSALRRVVRFQKPTYTNQTLMTKTVTTAMKLGLPRIESSSFKNQANAGTASPQLTGSIIRKLAATAHWYDSIACILTVPMAMAPL